jgi:hypothetical protein
MDLTNLDFVSATEAARLIHDGRVSPEQLVASCLERIAKVDGDARLLRTARWLVTTISGRR